MKPPGMRPTASEDQLRVVCEPRAEQAVASGQMEFEFRAWVKRLPSDREATVIRLFRTGLVLALMSLAASAQSQEAHPQCNQPKTPIIGEPR